MRLSIDLHRRRLAIGVAVVATPMLLAACSNTVVAPVGRQLPATSTLAFQQAEAMPILQSGDMQSVGGGYDSTDPHVGCIFSLGPPSPKVCNPVNAQFRNMNRVIRNNTANLYPAWSKLGSPVKLISLLGCQTKLDLQKGTDGKSGFQKEIEYFGSLMKRYPQLNVAYLGHPLMLVYIGTPVDPAILDGAVRNAISIYKSANGNLQQ